MNDRLITSAMLFGYMKPGQAYHVRHVAEAFGIASAAMRHALNMAVLDGVLDHRTHNGVHLYSRPADKAPVPMMKPMTISREMRAAVERCKELYVHPSKHQ